MNSKMGTTLMKWPSHEAIHRAMPFCFRVHYGLWVTAIIDCFELYIEKPSNLFAKACVCSQHNTAKYLIVITPREQLVSFLMGGEAAPLTNT